MCVGERFGGLDCEINQSSTSNQKRLESALRDDDVKYQRHEVISGKNAHFLEKESTSRALSPSHCRSLQKLNSEYAKEQGSRVPLFFPFFSFSPFSLFFIILLKAMSEVIADADAKDAPAQTTAVGPQTERWERFARIGEIELRRERSRLPW